MPKVLTFLVTKHEEWFPNREMWQCCRLVSVLSDLEWNRVLLKASVQQGHKYRFLHDLWSLSESAEISHADSSYVKKKCPFRVFSLSTEKRLDTHAWQSMVCCWPAAPILEVLPLCHYTRWSKSWDLWNKQASQRLELTKQKGVPCQKNRLKGDYFINMCVPQRCAG